MPPRPQAPESRLGKRSTSGSRPPGEKDGAYYSKQDEQPNKRMKRQVEVIEIRTLGGEKTTEDILKAVDLLLHNNQLELDVTFNSSSLDEKDNPIIATLIGILHLWAQLIVELTNKDLPTEVKITILRYYETQTTDGQKEELEEAIRCGYDQTKRKIYVVIRDHELDMAICAALYRLKIEMKSRRPRRSLEKELQGIVDLNFEKKKSGSLPRLALEKELQGIVDGREHGGSLAAEPRGLAVPVWLAWAGMASKEDAD